MRWRVLTRALVAQHLYDALMPPGQRSGLHLRFSRNGELMALADMVTQLPSVRLDDRVAFFRLPGAAAIRTKVEGLADNRYRLSAVRSTQLLCNCSRPLHFSEQAKTACTSRAGGAALARSGALHLQPQ